MAQCAPQRPPRAGRAKRVPRGGAQERRRAHRTAGAPLSVRICACCAARCIAAWQNCSWSPPAAGSVYAGSSASAYSAAGARAAAAPRASSAATSRTLRSAARLRGLQIC